MTTTSSDLRLTAIVRAARCASANVAVSPSDEEFVAFLARLLAARELDPDAAVRHAGDLLLACASAAGDGQAMAEVERTCIARVDRAVAGIVAPDWIDEVKQRVRQVLFVARPGELPKIATYAGRGPLRAWVRAAAIRIAMRARRELSPPPLQADLLLGIRASEAEDDPALRLLRDSYGPAFRAALEAALRSLDPRDRTLLRQHFVDGVGTEDLARLHGSHRVTMFRRLGKLRRQLLSITRRELAARIQGSRSELDSIMRAVRSRVDLTLERVLASDG